jgi:DNA polymerase
MDAARSLILHEMRIGPQWQLRKLEASLVIEKCDSDVPLESIAIDSDASFDVPTSLIAPNAPATSDLSWPVLIDQLNECHACSARTTDQAPQLGRGSLQPKVLVIGEFVNAQEHHGNSVYVGDAGALMSNMLASIDLNLDKDVFICKSMRCFSPSQELQEAKNEPCLNACAHFLQKQVDLLRPQLILCLGRKASIPLMGVEFAETAKRAQVYDYHGIPLILSLPPEILLKQAKYKREAWNDLCLLRSLLD